MDKRTNIEGSGASKMVQLMRKHGFNKEVGIEVGTVTSSLPNVTIELTDGIELDQDDLVLTKTVYDAGLSVGDEVIVISDNDSQFYYVIDKAVM